MLQYNRLLSESEEKRKLDKNMVKFKNLKQINKFFI